MNYNKTNQTHKYTIYTHGDADGGIGAAIFSNFVDYKCKQMGQICSVQVQPINHDQSFMDKTWQSANPSANQWHAQPLEFPCAILDFGFHPWLLMDKFIHHSKVVNHPYTQCFWLDHHSKGNTTTLALDALQHNPAVTSILDTTCQSIPGLLHKYQDTLGIPQSLMETFTEWVRIGEIIDAALYPTPEDAYDFHSPAVKVNTLFTIRHKGIDSRKWFPYLVHQIAKHPNPHDFLLSDCIFAPLIEQERQCLDRMLPLYKKYTKLENGVVILDLREVAFIENFYRFIPYILYPQAQFGLSILPAKKGVCSMSCGQNPWQRSTHPDLQIGDFFAKRGIGGGHTFVAGARIQKQDNQTISDTLAYLQQFCLTNSKKNIIMYI
jgi:hypothetical protein